MHRFDDGFWSALDALVGKSEIIICKIHKKSDIPEVFYAD